MNYFEIKALSFSSLRLLQQSPSLFYNMKDKKPASEALTLGTIVDHVLTEGMETFNDLFILIKAKEPTGLMLNYVNCLLNNGEDYEQAYTCSGFKQNPASIREKFEKEHLDYYNEKKELKTGLLLYTQEQLDTAKSIVDSLNSIETIRNCFIALENEEIYKQLEIFWEYKGVKLKSKLDVCKINKTLKKITIIDLKTTGFSVDSFKESIEKYQYWLQMVMYGMAVYQHFSKEIEDIESYDIEFKWVVESTKYIGSPCIYKMSQKDADRGVHGGKIGDKYYKGFIELMDDYMWYVEHNQWQIPRNVYQSNFEVELNVFN
jgi:hypothetical protein